MVRRFRAKAPLHIRCAPLPARAFPRCSKPQEMSDACAGSSEATALIARAPRMVAGTVTAIALVPGYWRRLRDLGSRTAPALRVIRGGRRASGSSTGSGRGHQLPTSHSRCDRSGLWGIDIASNRTRPIDGNAMTGSNPPQRQPAGDALRGPPTACSRPTPHRRPVGDALSSTTPRPGTGRTEFRRRSPIGNWPDISNHLAAQGSNSSGMTGAQSRPLVRDGRIYVDGPSKPRRIDHASLRPTAPKRRVRSIIGPSILVQPDLHRDDVRMGAPIVHVAFRAMIRACGACGALGY